MLRRSCLSLLSLFFAVATFAQQASPERYKETVATITVWGAGKHSRMELNYPANGQIFRSHELPPFWRINGAKYVIAYDTANPLYFNSFGFTRPVFIEGEHSKETIGRVIQTNFGTDIRYGKQHQRWIEYVYYAPSLRKHKNTSYYGYAFVSDTTSVDTNAISGRFFPVVYQESYPARSVLLYDQPIADTVQKPANLKNYKHRYYYTEKQVPIGFFMFNTSPNLASFTFHYNDPNSGTNISNTAHLFQPGKLYGGSIQFPQYLFYHRNFINTLSFLNFNLGFGDKVSYVQIGPSYGFQWQLTPTVSDHDYIIYPAVKAGVALTIAYGALAYDLGNVSSVNGKDMVVNGEDLSTSFDATYSRHFLNIAPEAGIYIRCSRTTEFRFSIIGNIETFHSETIKFYHAKGQSTNTGLDNYLTDASGNSISKNLFPPIAPIVVRLECALRLPR